MLGILIRGIEDVTVHTSGGLGFSVRDSLRPDLAPARPGYVYVTDADVNPKPAAPVFKEVTGGSGFVNVVLTCSEVVDGYYLEWSASSDFTGATRLFDRVGRFTVGCNTVIYLRAATIRGAGLSDWTVYGEAGPSQTEYTEEWIDNDVTAPDVTPYPNLKEMYGNDILYTSNKVYPGGYQPDNAMAMFSVASGIVFSVFGGKVEFRADFTANNTKLAIGLVCAADSGIYSDWDGAAVTFLTLYLKYASVGTPKDFRAYLSSWSAGAESPIADSGDIYSSISADVTNVAVVLERVGNTFEVWLNGALAWSYTSVAIPSDPSRVYLGLRWDGDYSVGYFEIFDYLRIYSRNYSGNPESVDAGKYYDGLLGDNLTDGNLIEWDGTNEQIVDSGKSIADFIDVITTPTDGNFPVMTAGGELATSVYGPSSFAAAVHTHVGLISGLTAGKIPKASSATALADSICTEVTGPPALWQVSGHILSTFSEANPCYLGATGDNVVIKADYDNDSKGTPQINFSLGKNGSVAQFGWYTSGSRFGYNVALASVAALVDLIGTEDIPVLITKGKSGATADVVRFYNNSDVGLIVDASGVAQCVTVKFDHIGEKTGSHGIVLDNAVTTTAGLTDTSGVIASKGSSSAYVVIRHDDAAGQPILAFRQNSDTDAATVQYDDKGAATDELVYNAPQHHFVAAGSDYNGSNSIARIGAWELQSFSASNSIFATNLYYDGGGWKYRNDGYGVSFQGLNGSFTFYGCGSGSAGAAASPAQLMALSGTTGQVDITYDLVVGAYIKASTGYKSADGTTGATADVAVAKVGGGTRTLSFKNGLYTGYTDS